jgi:hypothetical protein
MGFYIQAPSVVAHSPKDSSAVLPNRFRQIISWRGNSYNKKNWGMQLTLVATRCSICTWKIFRKISLSSPNSLIVMKLAVSTCSPFAGHVDSSALGVATRLLGQPEGMSTVAVNATFKRPSLRGPFFTGPENHCSFGSKRCGA